MASIFYERGVHEALTTLDLVKEAQNPSSLIGGRAGSVERNFGGVGNSQPVPAPKPKLDKPAGPGAGDLPKPETAPKPAPPVNPAQPNVTSNPAQGTDAGDVASRTSGSPMNEAPPPLPGSGALNQNVVPPAAPVSSTPPASDFAPSGGSMGETIAATGGDPTK
jgi:hypothetical protein